MTRTIENVSLFAVAERVIAKRAKYDRAAGMAGAVKVAFVVEAHGALIPTLHRGSGVDPVLETL